MISLPAGIAGILAATRVLAGSFPNWGDVPTWATAAVALAALIAAGFAYRTQAQALAKQAEQLELQRTALTDQQQANARQAEIVAAQLREMQQRAEAYERQQAEAVTVSPSRWQGRVPGIRQDAGPSVYSVKVHNGWHRPVRSVSACMQRTADDGLSPSSLVGLLVETAPAFAGQPAVTHFAEPTESPRWPVLRAGETVEFVFHYDVERHPGARMTVRFTDDAGLRWQVDHDQSLAKLDTRDW